MWRQRTSRRPAAGGGTASYECGRPYGVGSDCKAWGRTSRSAHPGRPGGLPPRRRLQNTRSRYPDTLEHHLQLIGVGRNLQGDRLVDVAALDELAKVLVEVNHPFEVADADGVGQLLVLALLDQVAD